MSNSPIIFGPNGAQSLVPGGVTLPGSTSGTLQIQPASATTNYNITFPAAQGASNTVLVNNGSGALAWTPGGSAIPPTQTKYLTPGTYTYNPPVGVSYINVTLCGGGGGGEATSGTISVHATSGSASSFGGTLLVGNGGIAASNDGGGFGGTATIGTGVIGYALAGGNGGNGAHQTATNGLILVSGVPGVNPFGGGSGYGNSPANTGAGGSGGNLANNAGQTGGGGGGAGGYATGIISAPLSSSYTVVVGAGGSLGTSNAQNGFAGGSGVVLIQEFYAPVVIAGSGGAITPTVQKFLSGSGTYTTPSGVSYIEVEIVGGGAGGSGSASGSGSGGTGGTGGTTTFGTSLLTATGGTPTNPTSGIIGVGGSGTVNTPAIQIINVAGGSGNCAAANSGPPTSPGGTIGGSSFFGGAGGAVDAGVQVGASAAANSGSGGAGAGGPSGAAGYAGVGGAAGGYVKAMIISPSSTYAYSVGAAGTAGTAGSGGTAGGAGGSGVIIVREYYANGAIGTATTITGTVAGSQVTGPIQSSLIQGTTTVSNATAGYIGELIIANSGSATPGASGIYVTIVSITLTAGDWDVEGAGQILTSTGPAITGVTVALSLNPTSLDTASAGGVNQVPSAPAASSAYLYPVNRRRFNVSTTTPIYLIGALTYTALGGTQWQIASNIQARRVR